MLRAFLLGTFTFVCPIWSSPDNPGGGFTSEFFNRDSVQLPAPKILDPGKRASQISGFIPFHSSFTRRRGLGPLFTNSSCGGCHLNNAKGPVDVQAQGVFGSSTVVMIGFRKPDGKIRPLREWNGQIPLGDKRFVRDLGIQLKRIKDESFTLSNGRRVTLYKNVITLNPRTRALRRKLSPQRGERLVMSLRISPPMVGMGLIEALPSGVILNRADPFDNDRDGIKGFVNLVKDVDGNTKIGRFGFKSQHPSLERQIGFALFAEMGIENKYFKKSKKEISDLTFKELVDYLKYAGIPKPRIQNRERFLQGYDIFVRIGCEKCHASNLTITGYEEPEFNDETISPFSDFLLHNLGAKMCDDFSQGLASGCDWRTTPLWGLGLSGIENGRQGRHFLHDGRAKSIEEAILWHGGEGHSAKNQFLGLNADELNLLLEFLRSL